MDEIRGLANRIKEEIQERLAILDRQTVTLAKRTTLWGILGNVLVTAYNKR